MAFWKIARNPNPKSLWHVGCQRFGQGVVKVWSRVRRKTLIDNKTWSVFETDVGRFCRFCQRMVNQFSKSLMIKRYRAVF